MFGIRKIWCALFSCYLRFKIRYFALSPTKKGRNKRKVVLKMGFRSPTCFFEAMFQAENIHHCHIHVRSTSLVKSVLGLFFITRAIRQFSKIRSWVTLHNYSELTQRGSISNLQKIELLLFAENCLKETILEFQITSPRKINLLNCGPKESCKRLKQT